MSGAASDEPTLPGGSPVAHTSTGPPPRAYPFLSPPERPDEIGRLGDYRIFRLLGTGGMGYVFEAEELTLHRRVALKVLRPELVSDNVNRERFLREARAAAAIASDHVVTIYHVEDATTPYLAMQFLEGESLQSRIEKPEPITLRTALEIARQTAEGLAAAHAKGLVHRDIKPANIWLEQIPAERSRTPQKGKAAPSTGAVLRAPQFTLRVKILDFGLARRIAGEPSLTSTGFIVGTPNFMSPEQASGLELDGRADLFSLGCVLFTMLTGELPFTGNSAMAVMMALANKTPPPVNEKNPTIPGEVGVLVSRLLEKSPEKRPPTAQEVIATLDGLLAGLSGNALLPVPQSQVLPDAPTVKPPTPDTLVPGEQEGVPQTLPTPSAEGTRESRRISAAVWVALLGVIVVAGGFGIYAIFRERPPEPGPEVIVVGILHSQTGPMAVSETPVSRATLLAIEELNASGGVLGRQIKVAPADGASDPATFATEADRLLTQERSVVLFGCWTSASRKTVVSVLDERNGILFYPVQFEGLEQSPRIVYLGPAPNQQLIPAVEFLTKKLGRKHIYFVGSDYVFPRAALEIVKEHVKSLPGVEIVREEFLPLKASRQECFMAADVARIPKLGKPMPDAVLNAINGSANFEFFAHLRDMKLGREELPIISLSISEVETRGLNPGAMPVGHVAASYFQTVDTPESHDFARKFRAKYGPGEVVSDMMAAAYEGVHLWAKAVEKAGTTEPNAVLDAARGLEFLGPRGLVRIDPNTQYTVLPSRIGRVRPDGLIDIVADASPSSPIQPVPFPSTRTPTAWNGFLVGLNGKWQGKWEAPSRK